MGEPAGIAPDITLGAWLELKHRGPAFVFIGDPTLLQSRAATLGLEVPVAVVREPREAAERMAAALPVLPLVLEQPVTTGRPDPATAPAVLASIRKAVELALEGSAGGIVTNPIQKETLYAAGFRNEGHTDYLADLARKKGHAAEPVMMLSTGALRTVPVTVHVPLRQVFDDLTSERIVRQTLALDRDLKRRLGIAAPRIAVTGLNPHAGENGTIGREEIDIILPAIESLRGRGLDVSGPFPADSLFQENLRTRYDAIVCMYHDQALIPVKALGFDQGVNSTLGLPFVRTSPDHGTALSLAGTGKASATSLISALRLAAEMAGRSAGSRV